MDIPKKQSIGEEAAAMKDRAAGAVKDKVGEATGNRAFERRGEEQNASGRARQAANDVGTTPADDLYVTNFYDDPVSAETAYGRLRAGDYAADDIDVVMSDETRRKHFPDTEMGSKAAEGLGVGGAVGGGVGAALAAVFAVGAVTIPGLGLVVAGPIAAALAGAGAGAAAGGLIGAMVGAGIPEERAKEYEAGIRKGGVLIGTRAQDATDVEELNSTLGRQSK